MNDGEDEVLVSLEQQDTRDLTTPGGRDMHAIGFTITKVILQKGRTFLDFLKKTQINGLKKLWDQRGKYEFEVWI